MPGAMKRVVLFAVLCVVFQVVFTGWLVRTKLFRLHLELNAGIGAMALRWMGYESYAEGTALHADRGQVTIQRGCDGIQLTALLALALLAFPAPWKARSWGLGIGVTVLAILNVVRVVSLILIQIHAPSAFVAVHDTVWPILLMLVVAVIWLVWRERITLERRPSFQ